MVTKTSEASPDKRRKYNEAFKAEVLCPAGGSTQPTNSDPAVRPACNHLLASTAPNRVRVGDITSLPR